MPMPSIKIVIAGIDELSSVLNKSMKGIKKMGESVRNVGRQLTLGVTLPIAAMGAMTLATAGNFESSMNRVQNLTQATGTEFRALQMQARELGAATAFSASQAADAMGFLGMAGFDTNQIMSAMPSTLNLAAASGMELAQSADIMSNILTGYNKKAEEATDVTDILVTTMQSANTNLEQLGEAMKFVAPVASSLGVDIKETSAAIGLLSNAGIQGAMAGTNLRGILAALAKPTAEAADTLERLAIPKTELFDAAGNIKSLTSVIKAFEKSGASTNDMMAIFGRKIGPGMMAMVSQGSAAMEKLTDKLDKAGGSAQRAADVQMKGLNGQLKALKSAFEELQLAIADSGLLQFATNIISKFANLLRRLASVNPKFLKFGVILAGVLAAVGPLLVVLGTLLIVVAKVSAAIATAGGVIALISNPIGWVVAAIMALIGIITFMVTHSQSKLTKLVTFFFPLAGVMTWVLTRWKRILPFIKLFVFTIVGLIKLMYTLLKPIVMPIVNLFAWVGDMIFKSLDLALTMLEKLTRLALPKWLENKIGLNGEIKGGPGSAEDLAARAQNAVKVQSKSEAVIRFEGNTQGLRVQSASPGLSFNSDRGTLLPEAN